MPDGDVVSVVAAKAAAAAADDGQSVMPCGAIATSGAGHASGGELS